MKTTLELHDFLNNSPHGVISTVNADGLPNATLVGFGQTKELELLFGTSNNSRKYENLLTNPHVAFTAGAQSPETIQFEGIARELDKSEMDLVRDNYWKKNPHAEVHSKNPDERYFIVKPTWIRYTDLRVDPWDVQDFKF